jgi:hypothetical protein
MPPSASHRSPTGAAAGRGLRPGTLGEQLALLFDVTAVHGTALNNTHTAVWVRAVPGRLDEREREAAAQAEGAREEIAELTALLDGFDIAVEEIRIDGRGDRSQRHRQRPSEAQGAC